MSKKMWVTLYTDASYCPNKKRSSWAIWAKSDEGKIKNAGMCPSWVTDNNAAELYAVFMGLKNIFGKWKRLKEIEGVFVVSDNKTTCVSLWAWSKKNKNKVTAKVQSRIHNFIEKENTKIRTKHIPAHKKDYNEKTMNSKEGHFLNKTCDSLAYSMLKKYKIN